MLHAPTQRMSAENRATEPKTILGVMAAVKGQTWFIKLFADAQIAAREKPRFEAFVKSLKLK